MLNKVQFSRQPIRNQIYQIYITLLYRKIYQLMRLTFIYIYGDDQMNKFKPLFRFQNKT